MTEERSDGTHVGVRGSANRYYRDRHPSYHERAADAGILLPDPVGQPGWAGGGCNCDSKDNHADVNRYVFDSFDNPISAPIVASTDGVAATAVGAYRANEWNTYDQSHQATHTPWARNSSPIPSTGLENFGWCAEVGGVNNFRHTNKPPGSDCGLTDTWLGWWEAETWMRMVINEHPTDMAGMNIRVYASVPSGVANANGFDLLARTGEPTGRKQGTLFASGLSIPWDYQTVWVPGGLIPAEGEELWIAIRPSWLRTHDADVGDEPWVCTFDSPQATGLNNSGSIKVGGPQFWGWYSYDFSGGGSYGVSNDGEDQRAWFLGGVPRLIDEGTGDVAIADGELCFTPPAGGGRAIITYTSAAETDAEDLEEDVGEPWTEEDGVRMYLRFTLSSLVDEAEAGTRNVRLRWNDGGGGPYEAVLHLGDPTQAPAIELLHDAQSEIIEFAQEIIKTPDVPIILWLDTRHPLEVVARVWQEEDTRFPESGETLTAVRVTRDPLQEGEDGDSLEVEINAGEGQIVCLDSITVIGPAADGQRVHEHLGSGDGVTQDYRLAMPFLVSTVEAYAAGHRFRVDEGIDYIGDFSSIDLLPVPDGGRIDASYIVDRGVDDGQEDPTEDDTGEDPA